jgi:hypothetical protein
MTSRDSCIFYRSMFEAIKELPKATQAEIYHAIFEYSLDFKKPELKGLAKTVWILIEPVLTKGNTNYINGKQPKEKRIVSETEATLKRNESEQQAYKDKDKYKDEEKDKDEDLFPVSIKTETAVILTEDSKAEKRKAHLFRNSKYHQNPELFRADFVNTTTYQRHPEIDPQLLFDDIQTSTDATDKYKYADWLAAAQNWCKRDIKRYIKRTFHPNPADNRMAEQIARVIANPIDPITGRPWNEPDTGGGQWQEPFSY